MEHQELVAANKKKLTKKNIKLTFKPLFVRETEDPYQQVQWESRTCSIRNADGSPVFELNDIEAPATWSQLAVDIAASKYFRRAGVPGKGSETSVRELIYRVAHTIRLSGKEQGYFASETEASVFEKELTHILLHQKAAFNSPVWFNCGLHHIYGIQGKGGHWHWNALQNNVTNTKNSFEHPQCSACFIQSVDDDLMGIFELIKNEARIFKFGSGSGTNFSAVRGKDEPLSGGGSSSGLMSFLQVLDRAAGATKSGGTTRRAAKMVCLDLDHPEIIDFIEWKEKEEDKVRALVASGYSSDFNGDAYATVSGQNSNNSIRISDSFMKAVVEDGDWHLRWRTNPNHISKTIKARDLWRKISNSAWKCADPGVQFESTIQKWHTCADTAPIRASNPCSEFMFLDDSACNLASINLTKFFNEDGELLSEEFLHTVRLLLVAQDILVDLSSYPTEKIGLNSHNYRPLGLGYANLGTLCMVQGLSYDSNEARSLAASITALMQAQAFLTSAEMAGALGAYSGFARNSHSMQKVIDLHIKAFDQIPNSSRLDPLLLNTKQIWEQCHSLGLQNGYRNSQVSVLAPTGTIGFLMDCDTTGIEPDYSLIKFKKLAGGGYLQIVNNSVPLALKKLGYNQEQIEDMNTYMLEYKTLEGAPHLKSMHLPIFDCANRCGEIGERYLSPKAHIQMMATVQPFISGAISKTVNLPHEATVEEIEDIYLESWKLGLKAVALYRDGCKMSQPLSGKSKPKKDDSAETQTLNLKSNELNTLAASNTMASQSINTNVGSQIAPQIIYQQSKKRLPQIRKGITIESTVAGHKIFLRTGEYENGTLGEIFIDMHKEGAAFRSLLNCFAISISMGLQYGVPLEKFVDKFIFTRFEPQGPVTHPNIKMATSIIDYIFRVLGSEYLGRTDYLHVKPEVNDTTDKEPKGETHAKIKAQNKESKHDFNVESQYTIDQHLSQLMGDAPLCNECGHITVRNGTCYRCVNCGSSLGCS
jgi:ribonucleoside-diphosphate reductase alpha chain